MSSSTVILRSNRPAYRQISLFTSGVLVVLFMLLFGLRAVHATTTNTSSLPPGFTQGYVHTDGIRLHYVQGGQGTPVVLLHGFPENWYDLNAYISYFSTIPQDVSHVQQLRHQKLSMPVLAMGADHSLGAEVGQQVHKYATHVRSVVITNSGHWLPEEHPQEVVQYLTSFFAE